MIPTHTKKPVNIKAFIFNGTIDCLDQDHVNAKLIEFTDYSDSDNCCEKCNQLFEDHACIKTISGNALVCPGDYIINNQDFPEDYYPCKPDIFEKTYDKINYSISIGQASQNSLNIYSYDKQIKDEQKLNAAKILIEQNSGNRIAIKYLESLISEQNDDGMLFGEIMALINEDSEIFVSRKAYDIDYICFNSETSQFMAYKNGEETLHSFETKDYIANDWYVVDNGDK